MESQRFNGHISIEIFQKVIQTTRDHTLVKTLPLDYRQPVQKVKENRGLVCRGIQGFRLTLFMMLLYSRVTKWRDRTNSQCRHRKQVENLVRKARQFLKRLSANSKVCRIPGLKFRLIKKQHKCDRTYIQVIIPLLIILSLRKKIRIIVICKIKSSQFINDTTQMGQSSIDFFLIQRFWMIALVIKLQVQNFSFISKFIQKYVNNVDESLICFVTRIFQPDQVNLLQSSQEQYVCLSFPILLPSFAQQLFKFLFLSQDLANSSITLAITLKVLFPSTRNQFLPKVLLKSKYMNLYLSISPDSTNFFSSSFLFSMIWPGIFIFYSIFIINMTESGFTTSKATLHVKDNLLTAGDFFVSFFCIDILSIVAGVVLWVFFWYNLNKLKIWDLKQGADIVIGKDFPLGRVWKALWRIVKNLGSLQQNYILTQCGFEAFSYMYFLKRFIHVMAILTITDLFIFVPYQLYFNDLSTFSLVTIDSTSNVLFRTFYMLWTTIAVFYSIHSMKKYLKLVLKYRLLRGEKRLLNNIKSKTVLLHFAGQSKRIDPIQMKTRLIEKVKIEDAIIACIQLKNNSKKIELQYQFQIFKIVKEIGIQNFHPLWKFFKQIKGDPQEQMHKKIEKAEQQAKKDQIPLNSYLIVFEDISTASRLVEQFSQTRSIYQSPPQLPQFKNSVYDHFNNVTDIRMSVNWAQEPNDIRWICIGASEQVKQIKYITMNVLSILLIMISFILMVLSRSKNIINIPNFLLPAILTIINSLLRWLISKSSEWESKHFQYQWHQKQMKVLLIFFLINVLGASIVRDTLNLIDILKTGWGWLELVSLIYKQPDGYFYYEVILNEASLTAFSVLFKMGDLFVQVFHSYFTYLKNTLVRHKSKYGTNDPFRYGYFYSLNILIFTVIFMYSASCPLIHFFGVIYFYLMLILYTYSLSVFHKYQQTCSNLRLLEQACNYILIIMISSLVIISTTMMFQQQFSSVLIIYFWLVIMIWLMVHSREDSYFLQDYYTDQQFRTHIKTEIIRQWKRQYIESMEPIKVSF